MPFQLNRLHLETGGKEIAMKAILMAGPVRFPRMTTQELRAGYFTERRELGLLNTGGTGRGERGRHFL